MPTDNLRECTKQKGESLVFHKPSHTDKNASFLLIFRVAPTIGKYRPKHRVRNRSPAVTDIRREVIGRFCCLSYQILRHWINSASQAHRSFGKRVAIGIGPFRYDHRQPQTLSREQDSNVRKVNE